MAQTELQLAQSNPQIHNLYQAYRNMYEALGVKNVDLILKKPVQPMPKDPSLEHIDALSGIPFQAFKGQDHRAHITAHLHFMATNMAKNNPMISASLQKNVFEHISLMALEQVEMEFMQEIQQLQMMQQNPQMMQNPQVQQMAMQINMKIESRKSVLIAEMMDEYLQEEKKINGDFGNDPIAKLKSRELDIRAQENARRKQQDEERINLDKMKAMMNQMTDQQKLDQNQELALLRADTSLEKTVLQHELKNNGGM